MKKIDLHVHTVPTKKDAYFEFELDKFKEYLTSFSLDAVAITNHNLFNKAQFQQITGDLPNAVILPGIEIDFENGHLLLVSENINLEDFSQKCDLITAELQNNDTVKANKLREIFVNLSDYLLVPHYDKKPRVNQHAFELLNDCIFTGEVSSPKKFNRLMKEDLPLTPVLFSDCRVSHDLNLAELQGRQTFIKTNSEKLSLNVIKIALQDKSKVFLSNIGSQDFFQVFNDGQILSNGLNIVLGERSSGKTNLLNNLKKVYDIDEKSIKYIEQFELISDDKEKFQKNLENAKSNTRERYLDEFKLVVNDVVTIDRRETNYILNRYIESLLEFALNQKQHDEFSNTALFTENLYPIRSTEDLKDIIAAVIILLKDQVYEEIINRHIQPKSLAALLDDLKERFIQDTEERMKKVWVNDLISETQKNLKNRTSSPIIEHNEIDFYDLKLEREKFKKFNAIALAVMKETIIDENTSFRKFKIRSIARKFNGAGELSDESHKNVKFSSAYSKYDIPIQFLEELKNIDRLEKSELYRYFCKVTYKVLNQYDKEVSGGERSEFNLLKSLADARQYEMLLIDEPESSFDNIFLKENVNKEIKDISKELPVIVVTHNNTVGMLMRPDYVLYTKRTIFQDKDTYKIFSGSPGDKEFKTADGMEKVDSYEILLATLEAGVEAYALRNELYNNFKK
ncbi:MAG: hypothetical protein JWO40_583 [Candidatus Doudnabacteria bacterium]|nr:hypothetical protein [Candidatus Doudnabacteria bacterium]